MEIASFAARAAVWTRFAGIVAVGALLQATAIAPGALAQDGAGDISAGRRLAETMCNTCHRIDGGSARPGDAAPSFKSIAEDSRITALAIAVFLQTPHEKMPNYIFTQNEITDLKAYIMNFRSK